MSEITTYSPEELSQRDLHNLLLTAVAPRPICFASTIDLDGNVNLSPFSFFNVFSSKPPVMVFSPARNGRDNTLKHTLQNIYEVKEVVINIVNHSLVEQMSLASTAYDKGVNEFVKSGLTQVPSDMIRPPRVGEAPVALECTVDQVIELGDQGGAGNLVIARVVRIHLNDKYLDETGKLDTHKLDLVARMGGSWYCRANSSALFEIPKPVRTKGLGIDLLPQSIRESSVLTGNNLGRLGNLERLPESSEVLTIRNHPEIKALIAQTDTTDLKAALHLIGQRWLENNDTEAAIKALMLFDIL